MQIWVEYGWHFAHSIYTRIKSVNPKNSMGVGMGTAIQNPMGIGMGIGMAFENGHGCGYSSTRSMPIPRKSGRLGNWSFGWRGTVNREPLLPSSRTNVEQQHCDQNQCRATVTPRPEPMSSSCSTARVLCKDGLTRMMNREMRRLVRRLNSHSCFSPFLKFNDHLAV